MAGSCVGSHRDTYFSNFALLSFLSIQTDILPPPHPVENLAEGEGTKEVEGRSRGEERRLLGGVKLREIGPMKGCEGFIVQKGGVDISNQNKVICVHHYCALTLSMD